MNALQMHKNIFVKKHRYTGFFKNAFGLSAFVFPDFIFSLAFWFSPSLMILPFGFSLFRFAIWLTRFYPPIFSKKVKSDGVFLKIHPF